MKKKLKRVMPLALSAALFISGFTGIESLFNTAEAINNTPSITVDMADEKHSVVHGAAGFLYGISNEGVPDVNTLTPLKPKVLATKGALGTEHPYGDALDVAEEFFEAGGQQVQMYNSNYYGVFGVTAEAHDYADVLTNVICPAVVEWKDKMREKFPDIDKMLQYIPINESTPINVKNETTGEITRNYNEAWKIYYEAIKAGDPAAAIVGPNHSYNPSYDEMYGYLCFCRDNNCLPDVITWHELDTRDLSHLDVNAGETSIEQYRKAAAAAGVEEKQVVINEYADFSDCGVPGRLVNWISRLEDNEVYGCLPFWHQANNLNDLAASANEGNGAWWVYKKYGDMTGKTLSVTQSNTTYDGFYGMATIDENKRSASVLCGGVDGGAEINLRNVDKTGIFSDDDFVHVKVEASYFTGYHGAATDTVTIMEGTFPVKDGKVTIKLENTLFSTAYYVTITETEEEVTPITDSYRAEYEAEKAQFFGNLIVDDQYSPLEAPSYYCSGRQRVGGIDEDGEGIEYTIEIPYDGKYKLDFLYGNGVGSARNNANRHKPLNITQKLIIDGEEEIIELPNTLFYSMESMVTKYADLSKGRHKIALKYNGEGGAFHDALVVSNAGAYGEKLPVFHKIYEAEQADFNEFNNTEKAATENSLQDFSGSGYVTGLNKSKVENGGGIRFVADVEESGMYNINYRYMSDSDGTL
ncbi:MAG: hypothetical protein ACI38A_02630 [Candidatus Ornithomonoglobus sp.]